MDRVQKLIASLGDEDEITRRFAAYELSQQGDRAAGAIPKLCSIVATDVYSVMNWATVALIKMGYPQGEIEKLKNERLEPEKTEIASVSKPLKQPYAITVDPILETIEDYVRAEETLSYGLMLKGKWGCGKTYYIKNTVRPRLKTMVPGIGSSQKTGVYVSLNGLQSTEEIDNQISMILLLKSEGKENEGIGFLGGSLSKLISITKLGDKLQEIAKDGLKKVANRISTEPDIYFVFDDVERCEIPIKRLFGYINRFVEQCDKRVILIADETKLLEDENYPRIKEKLIGQTLDYKPSVDEVVKASIHTTGTTPTTQILNKYKGVVLELFVNSETNNIRLLRLGLRHIDRIIRAILNSVNEETYELERVVRFTLGVTFEIGKGEDRALVKKSISDNWLFYPFLKDRKLVDPEDPKEKEYAYYERFKDRYFGGKIQSLGYYSSIASLVVNGELNKEQLLKDLNLVKIEPSPEDVLSKLREFPNVDVEEFDEVITEMITLARDGAFSNPGSYYSVLSQVGRFHSMDLVEINLEAFAETCLKGLNIAQNKNVWLNGWGIKPSPSGEDSEIVQKFLKAADEIVNQHRYRKIIESVTNLLEQDFDEFVETVRARKADYIGTVIKSIPIFKEIDIVNFVAILKKSPNYSIMALNHAFGARYRSISPTLLEERDNLTDLAKRLTALEDDREIDKIKRYCLSTLKQVVSEIVEKSQ